jgi:hypothetical protein
LILRTINSNNLNPTRFLALSLVCFFVSCGGEKSETAAVHVCPTTPSTNTGGLVFCPGTAQTATVDLAGGSGQQYVVAAYTLGDHSSVPGAGEQSFEFGVSATNASLSRIKNLPVGELTKDGEDKRVSDTLSRLIVNRYDSSKSFEDQESWIKTALDSNPRMKKLFTEPRMTKSLERFPLISGCPTTVPNAAGSSTITLASSTDKTSYCVGYQTDPTNETKANIEASIAAILSTYKDNIYKDAMTANNKDGYAFNPIIVFVSSLDYDGAFSPSATTVAKRPIMHVKASISKVKIHATIVHEMQHAIVDYYKTRGTTTIAETVAVDEGVAHLMEDVFGYGEDNFASYVLSFLGSFIDGSAILANDSGANAAAARGGANALMYFLAHRAGGFTVANGKPFTGPGMDAIVSMVKQTSLNGPAAVASAFGQSNLTERVGQMIGALFTDNREFSFEPAAFTLATYESITDALGATGKIFGLRFNNFRNFQTVESNSLSDASGGISVKYYESFPVLMTPTSSTATVTLTLPGLANTGVTVVRVK